MAGITYDRSKPPRTFKELYSALGEATRSSGETLREEILKRYINVALLDMHIGRGEKFPWAQRTRVLHTSPQYETGTVDITQGTRTVAGTSTAWSTANAALTNEAGSRANVVSGGKLVFSGDSVPYTIQTVDSGTAITLTSYYAGTTVAAGAYRIFEDTYDLPSDFLKPISQQSFSDDHAIEIVSRQEFRRRNPRITRVGRPRYCTFFEAAEGGTSGFDASSGDNRNRTKIQFNCGTSEIFRIPFTYVTNLLVTSTTDDTTYSLTDSFSLDSDEPIMPVHYRYAIVLKALNHYFRDQNDDARSVETDASYTALIERIVGDNALGPQDYPQMQPRAAMYNRSKARKPYSRRSGGYRYDLNGEFDRMDR